MTPQDHNKLVGLAHVIYGAIHLFVMLVMALFFFGIFDSMWPTNRGQDNPEALVILVIVIEAVVNAALTVPSFVAAYGLVTRKRWARMAGIIAGLLAVIRIPIGTAVGVYTLWFLFSEPGKQLYAPGPPVAAPHSA